MVGFRLSVLCVVLYVCGVIVESDASTIPCPNESDVTTFGQVDLNERPRLQKILQNGYLPRLKNATKVSSVAPGNSVDLASGYTENPHRIISLDCPRITTFNPIICAHKKQAFVSQGPWTYLSFFQELARNEMGLNVGEVIEFYNPTYEKTKEQVDEFLKSEVGCGEAHGYNRYYFTSHTCSVNEACVTYTAEFINDIENLPTVKDQLGPYHDFVAKWGYGTVDSFNFGQSPLKIEMIVSQDPIEKKFIYLGNNGGSGSGDDSEYYTNDECGDPLPVDVTQKSWWSLLGQANSLSDALETSLGEENLQAIRWNFFEILDLSWRKFRNETEQNFLPHVDCDDVTANPTKKPNRIPNNVTTN